MMISCFNLLRKSIEFNNCQLNTVFLKLDKVFLKTVKKQVTLVVLNHDNNRHWYLVAE